MNKIIQNLIELQSILSAPGPLTPQQEEREAALRATVPKPILDHFNRLNDHGKTGVAAVRHGCCCACHLTVCTGTMGTLGRPDEVSICDNCGRYLYPAPAEPEKTTEPENKPARKPRKKAARVAAV